MNPFVVTKSSVVTIYIERDIGRERESKTEGEKGRERERERVCVCACMRAHVCVCVCMCVCVCVCVCPSHQCTKKTSWCTYTCVFLYNATNLAHMEGSEIESISLQRSILSACVNLEQIAFAEM